ncbi:MAG: hypothetical protein J6X91_03955 [Bacteroidales bacterium]|nr:hypothetical protein [Bacteroidales bacterium]MBP5517794.1 hypothetical protein [Bacteroidales bacterium]
MKYRWLRNLLKGFSVTTALFVFTACYGTPQGYKMEQPVEGDEIVSEALEQDTTVVQNEALNTDAALTEDEEAKGE